MQWQSKCGILSVPTLTITHAFDRDKIAFDQLISCFSMVTSVSGVIKIRHHVLRHSFHRYGSLSMTNVWDTVAAAANKIGNAAMVNLYDALVINTCRYNVFPIGDALTSLIQSDLCGARSISVCSLSWEMQNEKRTVAGKPNRRQSRVWLYQILQHHIR